jgi:hypothetical protein
MPASPARPELLPGEVLRSDADQEEGGLAATASEPSATARHVVAVERLMPEARDHLVEVTAGTTVEQLKALYLAAMAAGAPADPLAASSFARANATTAAAAKASVTLRESDVAAARVLHLSDSVQVRLVFEGTELRDGRATLRSAGVIRASDIIITPDAQLAGASRVRLVAIVLPRRSCAGTVIRRLLGWSPFLLALVAACALAALLAPAAATGACAPPLVALAGLGAVLLLPYGMVFSGLTQDECGRRLLWPLRHPHTAAAACCGALMLISLIGCVALGSWLFGDAGDACRARAPIDYCASLAVWLLLLAANAPWIMLFALPCLLACRSPLAFGVLAHLSGIRGGMQR